MKQEKRLRSIIKAQNQVLKSQGDILVGMYYEMVLNFMIKYWFLHLQKS